MNALKSGRPLLLLCAACATAPAVTAPAGVTVAVRSDLQMAGVAASRDGRIFVAMPQWGGPRHLGVAEVKGEALVPFPDAAWNDWDGSPARAGERFVCAHGIYADGDSLWVVDPASPEFAGVVEGGLKVVKIDLASNRVSRVYSLTGAAPKASYVQDIRIDAKRGLAYLADAMGAALITLDLQTGRFKRHLDGAAATKAEPGFTAMIQGQPWLGADGKPPPIGVDGIEYDPRRDLVYFHALDGKTLWRIPAALLGLDADDGVASRSPERVAETGAADGLLLDRDGSLLVTSLEDDAVKRLDADGHWSVVARDPQLAWPDTLALARDGALLVAASQIHRMPGFNHGQDRRVRPFEVLRLPARP